MVVDRSGQRLVIRQTSAGLGDYLLEANAENARTKGVVIAYDGRHGSKECRL